ncbi:MAG TPA: MarR family transcriptional regulator [Candidatus Avipropionibacterium avicola]|uniref:MarR family transcriptional regulator n=1 Tax=Candidatus Avipropionibacterium avicola TaxID=2840701 RepID=A0A9D1H0H6_9ACTN|nr:MarR family transcriptional regulator [Candidatus Avipropionibacterium avicola]
MASALRPAVLRLARRLRQMRAHDFDLGTGQLQAMGCLFRNGPMSIGELAQREQVRPPSMTRTVDSLEELGLATRQTSEEDRRRAMVELTDTGRDLVVKDRQRRDAWLTQRVADLTPQERAVLREAIPILEKVTAE